MVLLEDLEDLESSVCIVAKVKVTFLMRFLELPGHRREERLRDSPGSALVSPTRELRLLHPPLSFSGLTWSLWEKGRR